MGGKLNCWEFRRCGKNPGPGASAGAEACRAATRKAADGLHGGSNGGRVCWVIAGTLREGRVQGTFAAKIPTCFHCEFFHMVVREELDNYIPVRQLRQILKGEC